MLFDKARDKYLRDATFKQTVDMMVVMMMNGQLHPGEMREAALMAEIKFRQSQPVNSLFPEINIDKYISHTETVQSIHQKMQEGYGPIGDVIREICDLDKQQRNKLGMIYIDIFKGTYRQAVPIHILIEHPDVQAYEYDSEADSFGLECWFSVDSLDRSTEDENIFFYWTRGKEVECTADSFLYVGQEDYEKIMGTKISANQASRSNNKGAFE